MLQENLRAPKEEPIIPPLGERSKPELAALLARNIREGEERVRDLERQAGTMLEAAKEKLEKDKSLMAEEIAKKRPEVLGMCRKWVRTRGKGTDPEALAEDMAQEVMMKAIRFSGSFKGESRLTSWLGTITRNIINDHFRRQGRKPQGSVDVEDIADRLASEDTGEENLIDAMDKEKALVGVDAAIERLRNSGGLDEVDKTILTLHYDHELPAKQIGEQLDMKEETVKSRLHRMRERIRLAL